MSKKLIAAVSALSLMATPTIAAAQTASRQAAIEPASEAIEADANTATSLRRFFPLLVILGGVLALVLLYKGDTPASPG